MRSIEEVQPYAMGVIRGKNAIFPLIASPNEFARSIQARLYRSHLQVRAVYTQPEEMYLFVIALNQVTGEPLGLIQFLISPEYNYGSVKACYFGVKPQAQNCGIENLLLANIFNVLPTTTRLFLHTRGTNIDAIAAYQALGFVQFCESMPN